jgi:glycosyltransferase A (GT-A) superfamily protein (DUF2064 family)
VGRAVNRNARIPLFMKSGNAICILAKNPRTGLVKNGLECLIGDKQAALLARALLFDVIAASLKIPKCDVYIAHWPPDSAKDFENILYLFKSEEKNKKIAQRSDDIMLIPQRGEKICERMANISDALFKMGNDKILFVCSDNPLIDPMIFKIAFELLKENRAVLGPTFDGGFYILGFSDCIPGIFDNINWVPGKVYRELKTRFEAGGFPWQELELSYDIDRPEELEQLYDDIDTLRLTGINDLGYHTEKCLENLKK